jgi:hypothetical protein
VHGDGDGKGALKHKAVYRSGAMLAEEGIHEKDAKIERMSPPRR